MTDDLMALVAEAIKETEAMTPEQRAEMVRKQRDGYVRAEMSWPAPRYRMVNGVKVYESYEDYCNG